MEAILTLLIVQAALGGLDTILNHELLEDLPNRPAARTEIGLHALREANYAVLFAGLGWAEWHGSAAAIVALLLVGEVAITTVDEAVENRTRVLPQNERVLHVLLTLNLGAIITLLVPTLVAWWREPAAIVVWSHGLPSWLLLAFGCSSAGWAVRDFVAWRRLALRLNVPRSLERPHAAT